MLWFFCAVRTEAQNCKVFGKQSETRKEGISFLPIYQSVACSEKGNIVLKSWVENGWKIGWRTVETFLPAGFSKARLVWWCMSFFEFSKLSPKISIVMEFVLLSLLGWSTYRMMNVTILFSPSLSRLFLFQAGFSFYQVCRQGCFRGSGVYFGDRLCSALFKSTTGICF